MYFVSTGGCIYRIKGDRLQGFTPWLPITWTDMGVPDVDDSLFGCEGGTLEVIEKCFKHMSLRNDKMLKSKPAQWEEGVDFCLGI
jgi:hypothetical protein